MSLLSIAQDVADAIGLARPTAVISSTNQVSRQILAMAKETLDELAGMDTWPVLEVVYTFPTVVEQETYALPDDFGRLIGDSTYLASQYYQMRGSLSPGDWSRQRDALPTQIGRYKMRLFGDPVQMHIVPTPQTVETVMFEYLTTNRVIKSNNTRGPTYEADTDVCMLPETLVYKGTKWRLKRAKGLDYSEEFNDYETSRARMLAQALAFGSTPVAYRHLIEDPEIPIGWIPEWGYGGT